MNLMGRVWEVWGSLVSWCYAQRKHVAAIGFISAIITIIGAIIWLHSNLHFEFDFFTNSPAPALLKNASLYIQSSDVEFSEELSRQLENSGIHVVPVQTNAGLILQIGKLLITGPSPDSSSPSLVWSATAKTHIRVRKEEDKTLLLDRDVSATTDPPTHSPDTAIADAQRRLAANISGYLDQNRNKVSLHP